MLDPKRRQGFLRSLVDFRSAFAGIQRKHALLNKHSSSNGTRSRSGKFPLLLSSGPRQNYTAGTGDEGVVALRAPDDVRCLVGHLVGQDVASFGGGDGGVGDGIYYDDECDGKERRKGSPSGAAVVTSAAERVLARARERASGAVAVRTSGSCEKRWRRAWDVRAHVADETKRRRGDGAAAGGGKAGRGGDDGREDEDDEDDIGSPYAGGGASLVDWLSRPIRGASTEEPRKTDASMDGEADAKVSDAQQVGLGVAGAAPQKDGARAASGPRLGASSAAARILARRSSSAAAAEKALAPPHPAPSATGDSLDDRSDGSQGEDLEDGFIAL